MVLSDRHRRCSRSRPERDTSGSDHRTRSPAVGVPTATLLRSGTLFRDVGSRAQIRSVGTRVGSLPSRMVSRSKWMPRRAASTILLAWASPSARLKPASSFDRPFHSLFAVTNSKTGMDFPPVRWLLPMGLGSFWDGMNGVRLSAWLKFRSATPSCRTGYEPSRSRQRARDRRSGDPRRAHVPRRLPLFQTVPPKMPYGERKPSRYNDGKPRQLLRLPVHGRLWTRPRTRPQEEGSPMARSIVQPEMINRAAYL